MHFDLIELSSSDTGASDDACIKALVTEIKETLAQGPSLNSDSFQRTKTLRQLLKNLAVSSHLWHWKFLGIDAIPNGLFNENYVVDLVTDRNLGICAERHRLLVELCFDNRQAIGTNILKLEAAARQFEAKTGGKAYCLLICADRKALTKGLWDSGVGDEEEYQIAISTAYKEFLKRQFSLLVLRDR
jgi:hypothetical protein